MIKLKIWKIKVDKQKLRTEIYTSGEELSDEREEEKMGSGSQLSHNIKEKGGRVKRMPSEITAHFQN